MHSIKWSDLQYVLAVANNGSVAAAARALKVNHSTVLRRIDAFEYRHKLRAFHRHPNGYKLTAQGEKLLRSAREIEENVKDLERMISGQESKLEGQLKITTTDSLLSHVLGRHIAAFHRAFPKIQLEMQVTPRQLDLAQLDAEVAIRPAAATLPQPLYGVRVCNLALSAYASPHYLSSISAESPRDSAQWLLPSMLNEKSPLWQTLAQQIPATRVMLRADSFEALRQAAELGMGVAVLPCFIGEPSQQLQRVTSSIELISQDLWIMTHKDLAASARVRTFMEFMAKALETEHSRIAGATA